MLGAALQCLPPLGSPLCFWVLCSGSHKVGQDALHGLTGPWDTLCWMGHLNIYSSPPCNEQGHFQLGQVAQHHPNLEYF